MESPSVKSSKYLGFVDMNYPPSQYFTGFDPRGMAQFTWIDRMMSIFGCGSLSIATMPTRLYPHWVKSLGAQNSFFIHDYSWFKNPNPKKQVKILKQNTIWLFN